jgi:peptidoglycan/LPS O-acetylase OafA/YrhL
VSRRSRWDEAIGVSRDGWPHLVFAKSPPTLARISRLYSVVVSTLALTALLQAVGSVLNPELYAQLSRGFDLPRYILTGIFLQSFWVIGASPPTNAPFWSLAYEFWYYALFGAFMLIRSNRLKAWAVLAISLFAGPEILLLFPCWLVGVVAYVLHDRILMRPVRAKLGFALSLFVLLSVILTSISCGIPSKTGCPA